MKFKYITAIALCAMAFVSCDEEAATIGDSLTSENDKLIVSTHTFNVPSLPVNDKVISET